MDDAPHPAAGRPLSAVRCPLSAVRCPLSGITVIDLSHVYNGPHAIFLLATAGATVIKVGPLCSEHLPSRGDIGGAALPFAILKSNKQAVTLMKTRASRQPSVVEGRAVYAGRSPAAR